MLKRIVTTAFICSSSLISAACSTKDVQGVLVGAFAGEEPMVSAIVIPASKDGEYQMYFGLHPDGRVCLVSGQIPTAGIPFFQACEGLSGVGRISCNDGRTSTLQWSLTSCHGGYGRSTERADSRFYFGFADNEAQALEQLRKARQDD